MPCNAIVILPPASTVAINSAIEVLIHDLKQAGAMAVEGRDTILSVPISHPDTGAVDYVVGTFDVESLSSRLVVRVDVMSHPEWVECESLVQFIQRAITDYDRRVIQPTRDQYGIPWAPPSPPVRSPMPDLFAAILLAVGAYAVMRIRGL